MTIANDNGTKGISLGVIVIVIVIVVGRTLAQSEFFYYYQPFFSAFQSKAGERS
ncbi:MAG: hypothetical protein Q8P01_00695 [bacterium]|nr:hypothetical protein [bacterium]